MMDGQMTMMKGGMMHDGKMMHKSGKMKAKM